MTERCAVAALRSLDLSLAVQAADGIPELLPAHALTIEEVWVIANFAHFGPSIPGTRAMLTVSPSKARPQLIAVRFFPGAGYRCCCLHRQRHPIRQRPGYQVE